MIDLTVGERRANLLQSAVSDGLPDETWSFPFCEVIRIGGSYIVLMAEGTDDMAVIGAVYLRPKAGRDISDIRLKLDDGADPTVYDISEDGVVTWDQAVKVCTVIGGGL